MTYPSRDDLQVRIRILERQRDELTVSLACAKADVFALEAEADGLRKAIEKLTPAPVAEAAA